MREPENTKFTERLHVPMPRCLADATGRAAAARLQDKSEYARQAILNQLEHDGVVVELNEVAA